MRNNTQNAGFSILDFEKNLTFGEYLRLILKADNITQEEFAKKMKCSKNHIERIISGKYQVNLDDAKMISDVLGYSLSVLIDILKVTGIKK